MTRTKNHPQGGATGRCEVLKKTVAHLKANLAEARLPQTVRPACPVLYFPRLSYFGLNRSLFPVRQARRRLVGEEVAGGRPSAHDDGYQATPCARGAGHVIIPPARPAVL